MSAGGTRAVSTVVKGIQLAEGFGWLAEEMNNIALVRSMVSKEGDHERGTYVMKTGYRPDPTVVHPSIGAVCCHELPVGKTEIPRHISILPSQWPGLGGFLGDEYNAFKTGDPAQKVPDLTAQVPTLRDRRRLEDLDVVEQAFARGRRERVERHAAPRHRCPGPHHDDLRTIEGFRRHAGTSPAAHIVRRHCLWPRLPGRAGCCR